MKFKNFHLKENLIRFIFLFGSLVLLIIFKMQGLWFIMVFYIILSLANAIYHHKKTEL